MIRSSTISSRGGRPRRPALVRGRRVDDQVVAVEVVEHDHVERGGGRALLLVAAHVEVVVPRPAVRQPVDEPGVAVVGEDHRLVDGEQRVDSASHMPCGCSDPARAASGRRRSPRAPRGPAGAGGIAAAASASSVGMSPAAAEHDVGLFGLRSCPLEDPDAAGAVHDRVGMLSQLGAGRLPATTTLTYRRSAGSGRPRTAACWRQREVDAHHVRLLVTTWSMKPGSWCDNPL